MPHVLLIGHDRQRASGVRALLRQDGHHVTWLRAEDDWQRREREILPDLVVAAVGSAKRLMTGPPTRARGFAPPVLLVQHEPDFQRDLHADDRLVDLVCSPFLGEELLARVDALLTVRRVIRRGRAGAGPADEAASGPAVGLTGRVTSWLRQRRVPRDERPENPYLEVAARVAEWADRRDAFQAGHSRRVATLCGMVADALKLGEPESSALSRAALLHDIGKVALPVEVLHQKGPLQEAQRRLIRQHPARGAALLRALDPDEQMARVVLYHHECPNGQGYYHKEPRSIPRASYVLAVAEAFDAMTSTRLAEPLSAERAMVSLEEVKGERYDADCVEALVDSLRPRARSIPLSR